MKLQKNQGIKYLFTVLMITLISFGLLNANSIRIFAQAPGVIVRIDFDTTWKKAESPYELTGPLLVSNGVTLTIEAGVNVSLNGYGIGVEGTLRALGNSAEKINFINGFGAIEFKPNSNPWNDQTGSGCIIEHVVGDFGIKSDVSLKVSNCVIGYTVELKNSSMIHESEICYHLTAENSNIFSYITVDGPVTLGNSNVIRNSNVSGDLLCGNSLLLADSLIGGEVTVGESSQILNNTISGHLEASNSEIANNTIRYGFEGDSVKVSNNVVYGSGLLSAGMFGSYTIPPISVSGLSEVVGNTIYGKDETPGIKVSSGTSNIIGNNISDADIGIFALGGGQIEGNQIENCSCGIQFHRGAIVIRNNVISNTYTGVYCDNKYGSAIIERNIITNSERSVNTASKATIQNNTFTNNDIAITLYELDSSNVTIVHNNIQNCAKHSIYLLRTTGNFDFKNNWWGTTDAQAISLTIHDFKYDFNLGKVNFEPFLSEPNSQATPNKNLDYPDFVIPEFSTLIILFFVIVGSFLLALYKNKIYKGSHVCAAY